MFILGLTVESLLIKRGLYICVCDVVRGCVCVFACGSNFSEYESSDTYNVTKWTFTFISLEYYNRAITQSNIS